MSRRVQVTTARQAAMTEVFFIPAEVAALLRRSKKSFYRLLDADGSFPRVKLPGGGLLIPRAGLEQWLREHSEGTRSPMRLATVAQTSTSPTTHPGAGALNGAASA